MIKKFFDKIKNHDLRFASFSHLYHKELNKKAFPQKKYVEFIQRKQSFSSSKILMILAGFQPYYWDVLFERTHLVTKKNNDLSICVCIPGVSASAKSKLYELCDKYGWSSCYSKEDRLAPLQNYVIRKFEKAEYIYKIDEDIVISDGFINGLIKGLSYVDNETRYKSGISVPLINVNVFSFIPFLETVGKIEEYDQKFGKAKYWDNNIVNNPDVAKYLWGLIGDKSISEFALEINKKNKNKFIQCSSRYSIGAFCLTREVWEKMGYFRPACIGILGAEELELCRYLLDNAYMICCCMDVFVGHLGYGKQKQSCKDFFEKNVAKFIEQQ